MTEFTIKLPPSFASFFIYFFFFFLLIEFWGRRFGPPLEKNSGSTSANVPNFLSTMTLDINLVAKIYPQFLTVQYPPPTPENIELRILNLYLS